MKHEWRKKEKNLYVPKEVPTYIDVPSFRYITLNGKGNPNNEEFKTKIGLLYSIAYAIRMMPKKGITPDGYFEYTVYPLEGLWSQERDSKQDAELDKDNLNYTVMIRQPDFVTDEVFHKALEIVKQKLKTDEPLLKLVELKEIEDGSSVQMLHIGSYDDEPITFNKMKAFISENNMSVRSHIHREIYLSDPRKVSADKLKTVLRYMVDNLSD